MQRVREEKTEDKLERERVLSSLQARDVREAALYYSSETHLQFTVTPHSTLNIRILHAIATSKWRTVNNLDPHAPGQEASRQIRMASWDTFYLSYFSQLLHPSQLGTLHCTLHRGARDSSDKNSTAHA